METKYPYIDTPLISSTGYLYPIIHGNFQYWKLPTPPSLGHDSAPDSQRYRLLIRQLPELFIRHPDPTISLHKITHFYLLFSNSNIYMSVWMGIERFSSFIISTWKETFIDNQFDCSISPTSSRIGSVSDTDQPISVLTHKTLCPVFSRLQFFCHFHVVIPLFNS